MTCNAVQDGIWCSVRPHSHLKCCQKSDMYHKLLICYTFVHNARILVDTLVGIMQIV